MGSQWIREGRSYGQEGRTMKCLLLVTMLVITTVIAAVPVQAQSPCYPKILTTSTTASVNTEKPAQKNFDPSRPHPMIFDWTRTSFPLHSNASGLRDLAAIQSPFFQYTNAATLPLTLNPDMHSYNGWELIRQDFGYVYQPYFPSDMEGLKRSDGLGHPNPIGYPYFILYNRYTGILRVFVAVTPLKAYNVSFVSISQIMVAGETSIQTSLIYAPSEAHLLPALDNFESVALVSIAPFNNQPGTWIYADFPTMYDPCTCLYGSGLEINVYLDNAVQIQKAGAGSETPAQQDDVGPRLAVFNLETYGTSVETATAYHFKSMTFFTPGAKDNDIRPPASDYPMYNQTLGVFNLLKTPKVKSYYHTESARVEYYHAGPACVGTNTATRYYQLEEDVKYVVNPAAGLDMENVEILASLVFDFDYAIEEELRVYDHNMLVAENMYRYRTRYVPLGCLKDIFTQFLYRESGCMSLPDFPFMFSGIPPVSRAPKVFLKLLVRLPRADRDENTQGVLFVGTYPVTINDVPAYNASEWTTSGAYDNVPNDLVFQHKNVAGRIDVWNTITVDDGTDVGEYYSGGTGMKKATLTAGERITVKPGGRVHPRSTLKIGLPDVCSRPAAPVSQAEIMSFCTSTAYTSARQFAKEAVTGEAPPVTSRTELTGVTPNPSSGVVTAHYTVDGTAAVTVEIVNPLGVHIATLVENANHASGEHAAVFDGSTLPRGVYFCVLRCNGVASVGKFVLY